MKIKVITIKIPQLDGADNIPEQEDEMEKAIKNKLEAGYTYLGAVGGDYFGVLIFKKED